MAEINKVKKDFSRDAKPGDRPRKPREDRPLRREDTEFDKVPVAIRRVTKVVKGGRNMRFAALVVVGDRKSRVGMGTGKAGEVSIAIEKATQEAKKNLIEIKMVEGTIPHETTGTYSASNVLMFPAKKGTGIIAGGSARVVCELAGIKDIVTKIHGSRNKINCVKATLNGLMGLKTREEIASRRGISPDEV